MQITVHGILVPTTLELAIPVFSDSRVAAVGLVRRVREPVLLEAE